MTVQRMPTQAERITALETQMAIMAVQNQDILRKLDELLAFRNKGVGAFLLISSLVGTGLAGALVTVVSWFHK